MTNEDKRNWPEYNEKLVKRGWFYLSTDFVKNWDKELKRMNKSKIAVPIAIRRRLFNLAVWHMPFSIYLIVSWRAGMRREFIQELRGGIAEKKP